MCDDKKEKITEQELISQFVEMGIVLRTRAVTRQMLIVFCGATFAESVTVTDLKKIFEKFLKDPKGGLNFVLHCDEQIRSVWESHRELIEQAFDDEINSFNVFMDISEEELSWEKIASDNDYSQLYGKNSAWNWSSNLAYRDLANTAVARNGTRGR